MFTSTNPATGETFAEYEEHDDDEITSRLAAAVSAQHDWRQVGLDERARILGSIADALEKRKAEFAELMTREMGKPIVAAESEIEKCAWAFRHYAEHGPAYLEPDVIETEAVRSYVRYDPLGVLLAVMPWNFPFWQLTRAAAPNLMAGNAVLLKHASNVPGCALAIEDVLTDSDLPEGLFSTLLISGSKASELISDARVNCVTLTGSVGAGRKVAAAAGENLKKTVLELGGSDPFVVLDDADLDRAAEVGAQARLINNGESCIAAKRFIVVASVLDEFAERFTAQIEAATVGDPLDRDTDVGPMAREDLRDDLHDQVTRTIDAGATLVTGGEALDGPGWFYRPTVLTGVDPVMPAGAEETFGPAAAVIEAGDEEAAVALANASEFGLGASVWTQDLERGERVAGRIEAGMVYINKLVASDPRVPFGGVKDSGYGRELSSYGIREFVNVKTVWVEE